MVTLGDVVGTGLVPPPLGGLPAPVPPLVRLLPARTARADEHDADGVLDGFNAYAAEIGLELYPAQEEAIFELLVGNHVILNTPTGSGKSLVATAAHFAALAEGKRSVYTAPIKALVSEKFFALVPRLRLGPRRDDHRRRVGQPRRTDHLLHRRDPRQLGVPRRADNAASTSPSSTSSTTTATRSGAGRGRSRSSNCRTRSSC